MLSKAVGGLEVARPTVPRPSRARTALSELADGRVLLLADLDSGAGFVARGFAAGGRLAGGREGAGRDDGARPADPDREPPDFVEPPRLFACASASSGNPITATTDTTRSVRVKRDINTSAKGGKAGVFSMDLSVVYGNARLIRLRGHVPKGGYDSRVPDPRRHGIGKRPEVGQHAIFSFVFVLDVGSGALDALSDSLSVRSGRGRNAVTSLNTAARYRTARPTRFVRRLTARGRLPAVPRRVETPMLARTSRNPRLGAFSARRRLCRRP